MANVRININAYDQTKGAVKGAQGGIEKLRAATDKVKSSFLGKAAAAGAVVIAFKKIVDVMKQMEDAYQIQEQAETKLAAVLRATGNAAGLQQEELQNMASALQQVTTFGDEAIINMQALLLTFKGIQGEVFERTQELALDLSAAFGQDLTSSAMQLGKALEDPATGLTALRRIGVSFTEEQRNMIIALQEAGDTAEAQTVILDALEGQIGGVAVAMGDTATAAREQLRNATGDLLEEFGEGVSRRLRPAREALTQLVTRMAEARAEANRMAEIRNNLQAYGDQVEGATASAIRAARSFEELATPIRGLTEEMFEAAHATGNFAEVAAQARELDSINQRIRQLQSTASESSSEIAELTDTVDELFDREVSEGDNWWESFTEEDRVNQVARVLEDIALAASDGQMGISESLARNIAIRGEDQVLAWIDRQLHGVEDGNDELQELLDRRAEIASGASIQVPDVPPPEFDLEAWQDKFDEAFGSTELGQLRQIQEEIAWFEQEGAHAVGERAEMLPTILADLREQERSLLISLGIVEEETEQTDELREAFDNLISNEPIMQLRELQEQAEVLRTYMSDVSGDQRAAADSAAEALGEQIRQLEIQLGIIEDTGASASVVREQFMDLISNQPILELRELEAEVEILRTGIDGLSEDEQAAAQAAIEGHRRRITELQIELGLIDDQSASLRATEQWWNRLASSTDTGRILSLEEDLETLREYMQELEGMDLQIALEIEGNIQEQIDRLQMPSVGGGSGGGASPVPAGFEDLFETVTAEGAGLGDVFSSLAATAGGGMGQAFSAIAGAAGPIGIILAIVMKIAEAVPSLMALMSPLTVILDGIISVLAPVLDSLLRPIVGMLYIVGQTIGQMLIPVMRMLEPIITLLAEGFVFLYNYAIRPFANFMIDIISTVGNFFIGIIRGVIGLINRIPGINISKPGYMDAQSMHLEAIDMGDLNAAGHAAAGTGGGYGGGGASYTGAKDVFVTINFTHSYVNGDAREISLMLRDEIAAAEALGY